MKKVVSLMKLNLHFDLLRYEAVEMTPEQHR